MEPDTQLLDDAGPSGMSFVVKHVDTSVQLPAPAEAVSNPLFSAPAARPMSQKSKEDGDPDDYVLSSSESSEDSSYCNT